LVRVLLKNVKNYALHDVTVEFSPKELSVIIGPNGSGKTTLLKVIAGLVPYEGDVFFNGKNVNNLPPYKRNVLYIPQKSSLFSHMKVWDNVAFCLEVRKANKSLINERVKWALEKLSIRHLSERYPAQLSSGEAKRVAIARALVCEGNPLLLDELESYLDVNLRVNIYEETLKIARELDLTVIVVTHDLDWAMSRADKLVFLWSGRVLYSNSPGKLDSSLLEPEALAWLGSVIEVDEVDRVRCNVIVGEQSIPLYLCVEEDFNVKRVYIPPDSAWIDQHGKIQGRIVNKVRFNGIEKFLVNTDVGLIVARSIQSSLTIGEKVGVRIFRAIPLVEK